MEKVIVDGSEVDVGLEIKDGKFVLKATYVGKGGDAVVQLGVSADYFLDKLKDKIGGKIDDAIIDVIKVAVKAL